MIAAIALGLFAGVFTMAFMQGAVDARVESATKTELAHLQVHAPDFLANNDIALKIDNADEILENIAALDSVVAASKRLIMELTFPLKKANSLPLLAHRVPVKPRC